MAAFTASNPLRSSPFYASNLPLITPCRRNQVVAIAAPKKRGRPRKEHTIGTEELHEFTKRKKKTYVSDGVRWYIGLIGQERLLRPDEEVELGSLVARLVGWEEKREKFERINGRDIGDVELADLLKFDRVRFLFLLRESRRAKERMIMANLRLVISIAKRFLYSGTSMNDMIQEGTLGLIRAVEKFDGKRGFRFSTYATWWIKQAVGRSVSDTSRIIRVPIHMRDTIMAVRKATSVLSFTLNRPPGQEEIAEYCGLSMQKLQQAQFHAQSIVRLESPIGKADNKTLTLMDVIKDDDEQPEELVERSLLRDDIEHVVNSLGPRERDVVRMRYGLDDGRTKSIEEIGQIFQVTKQRVRQIEKKALRKLRHPYRANVLKDFLTC
eukprot:Plantae.Rhodophyta-Hildenbrandia_rubra.ctg2869.p2 GENE.Plantae.Rhodophyta-Hildenbrandia_rubra.ctg2869~~Plantae.Rhodophyta-Hildenbrandia_rubra.ctg2869.p2  ORF type:complete len:382 (-),score=64.13 Plantae.Rhodophyta-Hildenbrandia_rubra.ctg2869:1411-2556(-)